MAPWAGALHVDTDALFLVEFRKRAILCKIRIKCGIAPLAQSDLRRPIVGVDAAAQPDHGHQRQPELPPATKVIRDGSAWCHSLGSHRAHLRSFQYEIHPRVRFPLRIAPAQDCPRSGLPPLRIALNSRLRQAPIATVRPIPCSTGTKE